MKTDNLMQACQSAQLLARDVREAHTDAVNSANPFAEIALFDLIEETVRLENKIKRLVGAAEFEKMPTDEDWKRLMAELRAARPMEWNH